MSNASMISNALIVDDEELSRTVLQAQLHNLGYQSVMCLESGKKALDVLALHADEIKLVLCDLQMPTMNGIELVRRLGDLGYQGGLILFSGEGQRTLRMAKKLAQKQGLNVLGVLSKPIQLAKLKALLEEPDDRRAISLAHPAPRLQVDAAMLDAAIGSAQLQNLYQPKVCMRTGRVKGVESLVRWQHPEMGLLYPDAFISVAEAHDLIDRLTRAVMAGPSGALTHLRQWHEAGLALHLAVNVSMDNLADLHFPDFVAQAAQDAGVSLSHLVFEITECRFCADVRTVNDVLSRLRLRRSKLAIDDFGTGYSSLSQLHELPFDELKIDRQFVHGAHQDNVLNSILDASIKMARELHIVTIGEGVETLEDWLHLQAKGCDFAQGHWIAKPMAAECVAPWVSDWERRVSSHPEWFCNATSVIE